jgi:uncharacterized protein YeeX (DUF496 family)
MANLINSVKILAKYHDCMEMHKSMYAACEKEIFKFFKFTRNYPFEDFEVKIDKLDQGSLNQFEHKHLKALLHGVNRYLKTWVETDDAENIWKTDRDNYVSTLKDWIDKDVQKAEMEETVEREVQKRMKDREL